MPTNLDDTEEVRFHSYVGLPQPKKGAVRGTAIGTPGSYHRPHIHNLRQEPFEQEAVVTSETVEAFKIWSNEERIGKEWQYLY